MAKNTAVEDIANDGDADFNWETIRAGLGESWDFDADGPMIGNFLGTTMMTLADDNHPGKDREQNVYQFSPRNDPEAIVFVWGSYSIDQAFGVDENGEVKIATGDLVKVEFLGKTTIKGGKQQLNQYRVSVARRS